MSRQFFEAYGGSSLEEAISNSVSAPYQSFMHGKSIAIGSKAGEASFKAPPMGEYMRRKAVLREPPSKEVVGRSDLTGALSATNSFDAAFDAASCGPVSSVEFASSVGESMRRKAVLREPPSKEVVGRSDLTGALSATNSFDAASCGPVSLGEIASWFGVPGTGLSSSVEGKCGSCVVYERRKAHEIGMGSDIADEQLTESAASRTVEIGLGGASCSKPMEIEKRLQNCNWEESMTALRADFPIFKNSTSDMDYLCGIVLAIYFFDYSLKDSESTLRWSSTAMSALPDLVCRLTGVVGALSQGSGPLCGLLESVTGVSPSLVSVFGKLPSTLVMQYSERLSDGASRSLISCLKVSYRALLADRGNRSHHRSRFSIHIRSYKSWLPVAEFDRGGSDTGRLGKLGGRFPATMKSRAALTSKSRQAQEAAALTSTVGKLSNELASLNRKAKEFANSQRKAELEIRRLRNERKYDQQALVECRTSLHKILRKCEEQQAYNQSCINQQAHNLSRMSVEMDALHNQVCSLEEKNACLASDTALVQLSVSKSHESHLEALSYVNKNVAEFSQNIDNL